jgi:soluble lytic murein transglycosylase
MCLSVAAVPVSGQDDSDATSKKPAARATSAGKTSGSRSTAAKTRAGKTSAGKSSSARKSAGTTSAAKKKSTATSRRVGHRGTPAERRAKTARLKQAFVASAELRPMAQQLVTMRTPAAYAGVTSFAQHHTGDAAAAAYLALGRSYQDDKRYADAVTALRQVKQHSELLGDYADFLAAECLHAQQNESAAEALLKGFNQRYPDSIFEVEAPELEANVLLAEGDAAAAQRALLSVADLAKDKPNYELTQAKIAFANQQNDEALRLFKHLLLSHPLTAEAEVARARLTAMGAESSLTPAELRSLGDAYYNGGRYTQAAEQYHSLARNMQIDANTRNGFAVAAAACDLKLKRLTEAEARALPDSNDDNGARRLYLLMELARSAQNDGEQQQLVNDLERRFPQSQWLAEALFSSGNMYMLRRDIPQAVGYYSYLATHFPSNTNAAAAHWRAGWLLYRQGSFADAERIFDEQIKLYPQDKESSAALYWRGRLYELQDHKPALAAANYRTVAARYQHFFYAQMSRERLKALGQPELVSQTQIDGYQPQPVPHLVDTFPADSPHMAKARLIANAGLNEYIAQELGADPDYQSWGALAEAQIYASFGDTYRAMRSLKKALPFAMSASIKSIPLAYWRILFPEPYWDTIKAESAKNGLDPYLVASLMRQESEFKPDVISYANAYGLMQIEPSVGKMLAKQEGISGFQTYQLLNPETNIRLGCKYLRQMLDHFGGVQEYALAAYNAGDSRVIDWQAAGPYRGMDEFVESIPFTQTREYVQSILRNEEIYRGIDAAASAHERAGIASR